MDTDGSSKDFVSSMKHSLQQILGKQNIHSAFAGQVMDSSGGGTLHLFQKEMKMLNLTAPDSENLFGSCSLHSLQQTISNGIKLIIRGFDKSENPKTNAMQLLHSVHNLQYNYEGLKLKKNYKIAAEFSAIQFDGNSIAILVPILTCWWTGGVAAHYLIENTPIIAALAHGLIQQCNTKAGSSFRNPTSKFFKLAEIKACPEGQWKS